MVNGTEDKRTEKSDKESATMAGHSGPESRSGEGSDTAKRLEKFILAFLCDGLKIKHVIDDGSKNYIFFDADSYNIWRITPEEMRKLIASSVKEARDE